MSLGSRGRKQLGTVVSVSLVLLLGGCADGGGTVTGAAGTADTAAATAAAGGADDVESTVAPDSQTALTAAPSADVQPPMETDQPDATMATGAPEVTQDFQDDAGSDLEEYEYPADPAPAESVVSTLCNLNRDYFTSLSASSSGADDDLRMAVLGVSDLLGYWESLVPSYPEVADDVATVAAIQATWDEALLARDNGDEAEADAALAEADVLIETLPAATEVDCVP